MSEYSSPLEPSEFTTHARFVQRLARRLEADEAAAEDLVQDVWLAAVEHPPTQRHRMRGWLARVVRNKSVQRVRSESRRRVREESRASDEEAADTADLVERMELHQRVVRAVLEMPEPYRAVLVRRFSQEEETAAIARQLRLPEATVRTRLRRGVEKLRERLRGEMGGTPALFLASLRKLSGEPHSVPFAPSDAAPASASTATPLILTLVMKKAVVLTLLATAAVAVVWSVTGGGATPPQPPVEAQEVARGPEPLEPAEVLEPGPAGETAAAALAERSEIELTQAEPSAAEPTEVADEDPIGTVTIRVEDVFGNPIPQAKLMASFWRSVEEPSSSVWWGEEDERTMGESDQDGIVRLRYTKKHSWSNEGTRTVGSVGYEITHPEYITHKEYRLDVSAGETVVVLERGSFLIVSGWIDSPAETIVDVEAHLTNDVDVGSSDWIPIGDGRPSCSRIPPGVHGLYLSHTDEAGQGWFSEVVPFELVEGEQKEVSLELVAPRTMVGMVDEQVLRPVTGGEVELNLYVMGGGNAVMLRTYKEAIAPDGSFAFTNLPPGAGEIIGLCDGWVSARSQLADSNWIEPEKEGEKRRYQRMWQLQQLDPADHLEEPYVLVMEPTANAEITVLDPDGEPVEGARVTAWPNVHWEIGYSSIFLERSWQATTAADGIAILKNMPAKERVHFGVQTDERYLMPLNRPDDAGSRGAEVSLSAGATAKQTVRMDPPEAKD